MKKKFFYSNITCLDATEKMIQSSKRKLSNYRDINYVCNRVQYFPFKDKYDAVFVSMVFQNLENKKQKLSIYKKICKSLKDEGIFLLFGPVKAPNEFGENYYMKKWSIFLQKSFSKRKADPSL